MRRIIGTLTLVAALLGGVVGIAGAAPAATPHLRGCNESSSVRPAWFNPVCNDGLYTVTGLHWPMWSGTAAGSGEFATHHGNFGIRVMAWRVRHGDYTRFEYQITHHVRCGFPRSWTIKYYSGRWHGLVV